LSAPREHEKSLKAEDCILETTGLVKEFCGFVAVNDVDLKVMRDHILAPWFLANGGLLALGPTNPIGHQRTLRP
jgi:hypothetical protein